MRRLLKLVLPLLLAAAPALAASTINSLPTVSFPLGDPGTPSSATENLWITSGSGANSDFRITPTQLGYIFQGGSAPTAPFRYELWWNTATNPALLESYTGTTWVEIGSLDYVSNIWSAPVGGLGIGTLASAGTTDLGSVANSVIDITGTGVITSFGSTAPAGTTKYLIFSSTATITYNASTLKIPGAANVVTATNDTAVATALGGGAWQISAYQPAVSLYATLASPAFTGTPTAPTAVAGTDTTQIATTAFVATSFAPINSPAFTGTPTAPTPGAGDNSTRIATTGFITPTFAPLASPALTGVPTAPTAAVGTNTTQLATTAFVQTAAGALVPGGVSGNLQINNGTGGFSAFAGNTCGSGYATAINASGVLTCGFTGVTSFNTRTGAVLPLVGDYIQLTNPPLGFDTAHNAALSASVAGNNLTVSLLGNNGSAPSASNPVCIPFRSATQATGTPAFVCATSATSVTINSGSTLGTSNSVPFRIWVTVWDNAGVAALGLSVQSVDTAGSQKVYPIASWVPGSTTACNACGTATSAGVYYTTSALTGAPFRILGFMSWDSGLASAGVWSNGPSTIEMFGPGIPKPGDIVQTAMGSTSTSNSTASTSFVTTNLSVAITPTSSVNLIRVTASGHATASTGGKTMRINIGRGGCATIVGGENNLNSINALTAPASLLAMDAPAATSSQTYYVCISTDSGGTAVWDSDSATTLINAEEIMGALDRRDLGESVWKAAA